MTFDLSLPVNTGLLLLSFYLIKSIAFPRAEFSDKIESDYNKNYSWRPKSHQPTVLFTTYSPRSLEPFSGKDGGRILLAITGIVFDVTAGASFYGPDGPYGNFAGRDASRGMAKQSFDTEMLTPVDQPLDKLDDLTRDEIENMNGWIEHFSHKYIICGELVEHGA